MEIRGTNIACFMCGCGWFFSSSSFSSYFDYEMMVRLHIAYKEKRFAFLFHIERKSETKTRDSNARDVFDVRSE